MLPPALRPLVEFLVSLALAVLLVRTWFVESYIVPSGSMFPTLCGRHQRIDCPKCDWPFAVGVESLPTAERVVCPNCDWPGIETSPEVMPGDRLLVSKSAFAMRRPRRWEPIVFRSPQQPDRLVVKRVVGLPGETVSIRAGNVYIDGQLARKPLPVARHMATVVYDTRFQPRDLASRWRVRFGESGWTEQDDGFLFQAGADAAGGQRRSEDRLRDFSDGGLNYHELRREPGDPSRTIPSVIDDRLAYNQSIPRRESETYVVDELSLRGRFRFSGSGQLWLRLRSEHVTFVATIDLVKNEAQLWRGRKECRQAVFDGVSEGAWHMFEIANFDQQVTLSLDGRLLFESYPYDPDTPSIDPVTESAAMASTSARSDPLAIDARGEAEFRLKIDWLKLSRDVFYTPGPLPIAGTRPNKTTELGPNDYFVLGDNSPISEDSRAWPGGGAVDEKLLVGRPLWLHLPVTSLDSGGRSFRIPDVRRIGYIR